MTRLFLIAVLFTLRATAQQLTVTPSAIPGIELVDPRSPDFDGLVTQIVRAERPVGLGAALPYSLVARNRGRLKSRLHRT